MQEKKPVLIYCPKCQQETPLKVEKLFDDFFNLIGEKKICSFCKLEFQEGEIPYSQRKGQDIFNPNEERKICQYCKNYVVNPWTQKCILWNKEVTATDTCERFEKKKEINLSSSH